MPIELRIAILVEKYENSKNLARALSSANSSKLAAP
jgi:hypothetical protein